jgi:hypothetical protein
VILFTESQQVSPAESWAFDSKLGSGCNYLFNAQFHLSFRLRTHEAFAREQDKSVYLHALPRM